MVVNIKHTHTHTPVNLAGPFTTWYKWEILYKLTVLLLVAEARGHMLAVLVSGLRETEERTQLTHIHTTYTN